MSANNLNFAAQVDDWCRQTDQRVLAVFRGAAQEVVSEMQKPVAEGGNMPIDFGYLRSSIAASNEAMPKINPLATGGVPAVYNPGDVTLVIAGTEMGQPLYVGYTAAYAPHVEYGTSMMVGRGFVRLAAAQWQVIVQHQIVRAALSVYSTRRSAS